MSCADDSDFVCCRISLDRGTHIVLLAVLSQPRHHLVAGHVSQILYHHGEGQSLQVEEEQPTSGSARRRVS